MFAKQEVSFLEQRRVRGTRESQSSGQSSGHGKLENDDKKFVDFTLGKMGGN